MMGVGVSMVVFIAYIVYAVTQLAPICGGGLTGSCVSSSLIVFVYLAIFGGLIFMMRRRQFSFSVSLFIFSGLPIALTGLPPLPYIPAMLITAVLLFQGIRGCYWFNLQERDG